jgi:hypothetical protein
VRRRTGAGWEGDGRLPGECGDGRRSSAARSASTQQRRSQSAAPCGRSSLRSRWRTAARPRRAPASPALPQQGGGPPRWRQRTSARRPRPAGLRWRREALHSGGAWGEKGRGHRRLGREGTTAPREGRGSCHRRRRLQLGFACGVWCGSGVWCAVCVCGPWPVGSDPPGVWCCVSDPGQNTPSQSEKST